MKQRLWSTLLLIEFMMRALFFIWADKTIISWERRSKTISLTFRNVEEEY